MLRLWTCTDHELHYTVGGASIVMANTEDEARELLYEALEKSWLRKREPFTLQEVDVTQPFARVLCDGAY